MRLTRMTAHSDPRAVHTPTAACSLDDGSGGPDDDFTNRDTAFMTVDAGCRFDHPDPEHR